MTLTNRNICNLREMIYTSALIVSRVWAHTSSCNQPLPDVFDRQSVLLFVKQKVIFDPSVALAALLWRAGPEMFWEAHNGSAATSQKGLWFAVVKTAMVKWLQLWKRALWKPPSASLQTQLRYWHCNRRSQHTYNKGLWFTIEQKKQQHSLVRLSVIDVKQNIWRTEKKNLKVFCCI